MQISAINFNNSFNGKLRDTINKLDSIEDVEDIDLFSSDTTGSHKLQVKKLVTDVIDKTGEPDKKTSPVKFFGLTAVLGIGSFLATKRFSYGAFKKIANALSLNEPLNKLGANICQKAKAIQSKPTGSVTSIKTFFTTAYNNTAKWFVKVGKNLGTEGLTDAEKTAANAGSLCARNAIRKAASIALATGVAGAVVTEQYKDEDHNNIPDKIEEVCSGAKTARTLLGIVNDAFL